MSEAKITRAWGAACLRQVLIGSTLLLVFAAVAIGLVVLSISLPITPDQRSLVIFIGLMLFLTLVLMGVLVWGVYATRRRASRLDAAFSPLGLLGKAYLLTGRQYHGMVQGRQVDAYFYRGPSLDLYVASPLHTRMGVGLKGAFNRGQARLATLPEIAINEPSVSHLEFSSLDPQWGKQLLVEPRCMEIILRLAASQPGFEFRNLLFQPEAIQLQIYLVNPGSLTPQNLRRWMDDLLTLVQVAETVPAPAVTAIASAVEQRARTNRSAFAVPVLGISCAVILFFALLILMIVLGLLVLGNAGL